MLCVPKSSSDSGRLVFVAMVACLVSIAAAYMVMGSNSARPGGPGGSVRQEYMPGHQLGGSDVGMTPTTALEKPDCSEESSRFREIRREIDAIAQEVRRTKTPEVHSWEDLDRVSELTADLSAKVRAQENLGREQLQLQERMIEKGCSPSDMTGF